MLAGLEVRGVERKSASQCGARSGIVAEQPVLGRGLDQRRHRMAARHIGRQPVVGVGGVERGGLLKSLHRLFKLAIQEQLARCEIKLGRAPPVAAARRLGFFCRSRSRCSRRRRLARRRALPCWRALAGRRNRARRLRQQASCKRCRQQSRGAQPRHCPRQPALPMHVFAHSFAPDRSFMARLGPTPADRPAR